MKLENLNDLLLEQLRDVYSAEKQITDALPNMAEKATSPELKRAFELHLAETERQIDRLERIFDMIGEKGGGHTCKAMEGLIKEGKEMMKENAEPAVMDAGLIAAAQRVEHYEISAYGTACTYAKELGKDEILNTLKETLNEEKTTDEKLTTIAETTVNLKAIHA